MQKDKFDADFTAKMKHYLDANDLRLIHVNDYNKFEEAKRLFGASGSIKKTS